jgi:hypothetical protein
VTADQCPGITEQYLDQQRRALPSAWFAQECCCESSRTTPASLKRDGFSITIPLIYRHRDHHTIVEHGTYQVKLVQLCCRAGMGVQRCRFLLARPGAQPPRL